MGYYQGEEYNRVVKKIVSCIEDAMEMSDDGVSYIDRWTLNEKRDVVFIHINDCGCATDIITLDLGFKDMKIEEDVEFIQYLEEIFLEIDDSMGNSNFLIYVDNYRDLIRSCEICLC